MKESKEVKRIKKGKSGITLIALVITIIVLLILVGTTITMLTANDSILKRATEAKSKTEMASIQEEANIVRVGANINSYAGNAVEENAVLQREGLLNLLNEHFQGSTKRGNRIITKDKKYDIVVKNNLEIVVVKRGQSYLKEGEMDIAYYIPSGTGAKSKRIELIFDLGRDGENTNQQIYWDYAFSKIENLSEESLEDLLIMIHGLDSKEALYRKLSGKNTKEEAIEELAGMGMTYKEALQLSYICPIGKITQPVLDYLTEVKGKTFGIEIMYELMLQDMSEKEKEELIELGITDVDSYIRYQAEKEGRDENELRKEMEAWSLFLGVMTEMANKALIVHNPDGSQEEVMEALMFSEYVVTQNGEYTFTIEGYNGEYGTITIPVTGIE